LLEHIGESLDARQVRSSQDIQLLTTSRGELETHATVVERIALTKDQPSVLRAASELDGTVVAYMQRLGRLADRWTRSRGVAADDEQQLVKRRRKTAIASSLLAPAQELA
jgi:type IV secretory pathway protease TraF